MSNLDIIVDDDDPSITYTGLWTPYNNTNTDLESLTFFNNTFQANFGDAALLFPFNGELPSESTTCQS